MYHHSDDDNTFHDDDDHALGRDTQDARYRKRDTSYNGDSTSQGSGSPLQPYKLHKKVRNIRTSPSILTSIQVLEEKRALPNQTWRCVIKANPIDCAIVDLRRD